MATEAPVLESMLYSVLSAPYKGAAWAARVLSVKARAAAARVKCFIDMWIVLVE
jgi:hypothetical protein